MSNVAKEIASMGEAGPLIAVRSTGLAEPIQRRYIATAYVKGKARFRYGGTPDEARTKVEDLLLAAAREVGP